MARDCISLELSKAFPRQIQEIQNVLEEAPDYAMRATGHLPKPDDGTSLFAALPPEMTINSKLVYGIRLGQSIIGCIDVIRGYPSKETAMLGLLLLSEKHQHGGLGREAYFLLESEIKQWPEIQKIRIGIVATNEQVIPYWKKMGFVDTGVKKPYECDGFKTETYVYEKSLALNRGSCLCGKVTLEVNGNIPSPSACHCTQCRKHSGHFEVSTDVPRSALQIYGGEQTACSPLAFSKIKNGSAAVSPPLTPEFP